MSLYQRWAIGLLAAVASSQARTYEIEMHTQMSSRSIASSKLTQSSLLSSWGLSGSTETLLFRSSEGTERSIGGWILFGAIEEDGQGRPLNHFFDPVRDSGLKLCGVPFGESSPDWAILGTHQPVGAEFSYARARVAMKDAFVKTAKQDREAAFSLMFQSIGHVIHHLQDMAQPQHVRNDAHVKLPGGMNNLPPPFANSSRYELWAEDFTSSVPPSAAPVPLPRARDYWATTNPTVGLAAYTNFNFVSAGSNFRIAGGAVAPNSRYANPVPQLLTNPVDVRSVTSADFGCAQPTPEDPNPTSDSQLCSLRGEVQFVETIVYDGLADGPPERNPRAAMYSIFTQDLVANDDSISQNDSCGAVINLGARLFTVNRLTFWSALSFLAPKAVDYSAGMIDYLVRGNIDIVLNPDTLQREFMNAGEEPLTGTVTLYYDGVDDTRHPVPNGSWTVNGLASGQRVVPEPFPEPVNPPPKKPGEYMMVFTGTMGEESPIGDGPGAVVARLVKVGVPEFYWSRNSGCLECDPHNPDHIGNSGFAQLSFMLPPAFDDVLHDRKHTIHVKIGGVDYPLTVPPDPGHLCGLLGSGFPPGPYFGIAPVPYPSWFATLSRNDLVLFTNPNQGFQVGAAANFRIFRNAPGGVNTYPLCSNQLEILRASPGSKVAVEYMVGDTTLFKFCMREEMSDFQTTLGYTTVISNMRGMRVVPNAVNLRVDATDTGSCPGY